MRTDLEYELAREIILARCKARCEGCGRRITLDSMHAHHRKARSAGRDDRPINLLAFCWRCHGWTHANPRKARELGWIVRGRELPEEVPVMANEVFRGWAGLD